MTAVRIQERAAAQLDEIYRYTRDRWGKDQADRYVHTLFESFEQAAGGDLPARPIPAEFGVAGVFYRSQKHFVYCKRLQTGDLGVVAILHERMHRIDRLKNDFTG
ncbi:type II toxin-antitoxin system RelE/ParE family toxin [Wenzhouxiangella sp. XN79A]|uniref:type II toxin-antitoxin system RelE/ParE family toxin n=1 Tax=Wenzhouxiangella sp. XN79A TaxID=2724193 RepID=UPI00144A911C|nr:type II toxin-antitoxin system RelE/ParE family toxin [Wenzhouxiangella sp. XN79A]